MCDTIGIGGADEVRYWWSSAIGIDVPFLDAPNTGIKYKFFAHSNHR